ncbi:DinB family protein [Glutamicibacter sp.]|uniref:DinB family protein n=1 Tax=Glutamicibacter sp. TaxID=1931995 RepID=UPI0028BD629B|nr:DinB family protein [Glutamicibacter sp.]
MSQIIPDDKNWTFVLDSVCQECNYDVRSITPDDVVSQLEDYVERFVPLLSSPQARTRTDPARWSDQEYIVHVAQMLLVMEQRLVLMLENTEPTFPNWDQDQAAEEGDYNQFSAEEAEAMLRAAAEAYGAKLASIDLVDYSRRGLRSNGSAFTVETLNQYAWHDLVHHLWDLTQ